MDYPHAVARSDQKGLPIFFDAGGPARITRFHIALVNDGTTGWDLPLDVATDGRAVRGFAVKPVKEGVYALTVQAWDTRGCTATATAPSVTVVR